MLYKDDNKIYVKANNKFYQVELDDKDKKRFVPISDKKTIKYKLEKPYEINDKEAIEFLSKSNKANSKISDILK